MCREIHLRLQTGGQTELEESQQVKKENDVAMSAAMSFVAFARSMMLSKCRFPISSSANREQARIIS
jgi:hypothetical protein